MLRSETHSILGHYSNTAETSIMAMSDEPARLPRVLQAFGASGLPEPRAGTQVRDLQAFAARTTWFARKCGQANIQLRQSLARADEILSHRKTLEPDLACAPSDVLRPPRLCSRCSDEVLLKVLEVIQPHTNPQPCTFQPKTRPR